MAAPKKVINLGVILEPGPDVEKFNRVLTEEPDMDRVIIPRDVDQMLRYFRKLARDGVKIKKLVLMAHGSKYRRTIGMLGPDDVDLNNIMGFRDERYKVKGALKNEIGALDAQIAISGNKEEKARLKEQRDEKKERLDAVSKLYEENTARERLLKDVEDLMDKDAVIGLVNCYAAYDKVGKTFMNNLGDVLLSKNGGRVVGCQGPVVVAKIRPVVREFMGLASSYAFSVHKWHTVKTAATNASRRNCGAPCRDFERYGFCDRPASQDGGPCWMHR